MISDAVDRLVGSLGDLSPEQEVHAATARRLAAVMDGQSEQAPLYALPGFARELRNAVAALEGAPVPGQGVDMTELDAVMGSVLR
ncbi:hypothetical protein [Actinocorallia longicatena]|uniref:Uncharacterized protein n=1 Tax=Actinocorallia longicatena TaxID=111803 RepID=A0ABP6QB36_9ACTN